MKEKEKKVFGKKIQKDKQGQLNRIYAPPNREAGSRKLLHSVHFARASAINGIIH